MRDLPRFLLAIVTRFSSPQAPLAPFSDRFLTASCIAPASAGRDRPVPKTRIDFRPITHFGVSEIEQLLDRIVDAISPSVISAYERRIETLEKDKLLLQEKLSEKPLPRSTYNDILEHTMEFLANPCKLWHSEVFEHKRTVLKLAFAERLAYCRNGGYRTPKTNLPFKVLGSLCDSKNLMVRLSDSNTRPPHYESSGQPQQYSYRPSLLDIGSEV